eukprot:4563443-Prymnesium_polylepis.1
MEPRTNPMLQRPNGRSGDVRTFFAGQPVAHSTQLATSASVSATGQGDLIRSKYRRAAIRMRPTGRPGVMPGVRSKAVRDHSATSAHLGA